MANNKFYRVLKNTELKSRFFFAPINTGLAKEGQPTEDLINFHALRSNPYTGINYVGNVSIDAEGTPNSGTLYLGSDMKGFKKLALSIQGRGSIPGVQIACLKSRFETIRKWKNADPEKYLEYIREEIKNLRYEDIKAIIRSFQDGMIKLYESGFRAIQIHGAHGYFLNNFLSERINGRHDEFGKDRTLIIREILEGVSTIKPHCIIDLRISLFESQIEPLNVKHREFLDIISNIEGLDMISISNGFYNINKKIIYPGSGIKDAFMVDILSDYLTQRKNRIWNISGNIRELDRLDLMPQNLTFSIGRPIIADPEFIPKYFSDRKSKIIVCKYKNKCHYFSRNASHIECGVNPKIY